MVVLLLNATVRQKNCFLDANDDDEVDCLTPEGDICEALDFDLDGYADTCGNQVGIEIVPHQFDKFFEGAVSDCFCPDDCQIDGDGDGVSDCVDSDGLICTPESSDGLTADNCVTANVPTSIDGSDYGGVVVECYCPTIDCELDVIGNGEIDCVTPLLEAFAIHRMMEQDLLLLAYKISEQRFHHMSP